MLNEASKMFPSETRKASDICSSILVLNHRTGIFLGPIYGGFMNYLVGFRATCEIVAIMLFAYSVIFYLFTREYAKIINNPEVRKSCAVSDYQSNKNLRKSSKFDF